jgi:hypothetical protein
MPPKKNSKPSRRRNRRKQGDRSLKAPTRPEMKSAETTALFRVPIFAIRKRVTQLYYETGLTVTMPGTGLAGNYFFSANGIYDCNITGSGHQPMGFDQMMLYYEQCHVVRSTITICPLANQPCRMGIYLSPDTTSITDQSRLFENGLIKTITSSGLGSTPVAVGRIPEVSLSCDVASYFGRRTLNELLDDQDLQTTSAANPTEQVYFAVTGWQLSYDGSTSKSFTFDVIIAFDVIYWEPRKLTVS